MSLVKKKALNKIISLVLAMVLMLVVPAGCGKEKNGGSDSGNQNSQGDQKEPEEGSTGENKENGNKENDDKVEVLLKSMTLEEKVGQVFIMSLRYLPDTKAALELTDSARQRIKNNLLGGVILFSENLQTIPQTKKLIDDMQAISKLPMFIAIDEEGGATSRMGGNSGLHSTKLPSNWDIGSTGDPELARQAGRVIAEEVSSLGFNMDFAPIADVNTNPKNPVIGKRSFGADPELVAKMVEAEVKGIQEQNVTAVLKHFPGHGDTSTDTHTGAVIIKHNRDRLDKVEFPPFQRGIDAGADGIMTAHIQVPQVTKNDLPATLSKEVLTEILRNEMKFKGLIITDALEMAAISKYYTPDAAAVKAFEAGADILLMPESIEKAYGGLLEAVKSGRISEERLNESVKRILDVKYRRGILENNRAALDPEKTLGSKEHQDIATEIARGVK